MDHRKLDALRKGQAGLVTRRQVIGCDGKDSDIVKLVRRREWRAVHPGVYVDHTGPLTREQLEWAAVLYCAPAALAGATALSRYGLRVGRDGDATENLVHVAIERARRVRDRPGIVVTRIKRYDEDVLGNLSPPRVRLEHAVLDVASVARDERGAVAVLCDAVQSRRTTAARLLGALANRPRLRHRALLLRILEDVSEGAFSVLEREFLHRVERAHSLPTGSRQRRVQTGRTAAYRDVEYVDQATIVELDGQLGHDTARDRWDDLERDVDALVSGSVTVRLGWAQALESCRTAMGVAVILIARGWDGSPRPCSPGCPVGQISGAQQPPGARKTPQIG